VVSASLKSVKNSIHCFLQEALPGHSGTGKCMFAWSDSKFLFCSDSGTATTIKSKIDGQERNLKKRTTL